MKTKEEINYYDTYECKEQIKQLTDEIIGCHSRIRGFVTKHAITGQEKVLSKLEGLKDSISSNYKKLKSKEITLLTQEETEEFVNEFVKNWHIFHDYEKELKSIGKEQMFEKIKLQSNDSKVIVNYKTIAEEFGEENIIIID